VQGQVAVTLAVLGPVVHLRRLEVICGKCAAVEELLLDLAVEIERLRVGVVGLQRPGVDRRRDALGGRVGGVEGELAVQLGERAV
jgi:hypothetical protein